jgi:hypothetical protein
MTEKTVTTIDQRIRERAAEELHAELDAAAKPLSDLLAVGCTISCGSDEKPCYKALQEVKDALYRYYCPRRQDEAIKDFLSKVDGLEAEVQALRESAGGNY